jgi:NAD(P)-dependent dehydrogenase (short-subunit alcohol dehydrogenase family)
MKDKVSMVTGANSGIGKVIATELAWSEGTLVMACRDPAKGEAAKKEIVAETGNQKVELMIVDLASLASVRALAENFTKKHDRLHLLVNNAGLILGRRIVTPDGLETTFVVNYLSHFLLTYLLLYTLKASNPSRIVNVSSSAHYQGRMHFDDLQLESGYSSIRSYAQSKLAQVLFTHELAKRLEGTGVIVNSVHPGAVRTNWGDEGGLLGIGVRIGRPFMLSPERGAETPLYAAVSAEVEGITGKYFSKKKDTRSSNESYDEGEEKRLWDVSMKLSSLQALEIKGN